MGIVVLDIIHAQHKGQAMMNGKRWRSAAVMTVTVVAGTMLAAADARAAMVRVTLEADTGGGFSLFAEASTDDHAGLAFVAADLAGIESITNVLPRVAGTLDTGTGYGFYTHRSAEDDHRFYGAQDILKPDTLIYGLGQTPGTLPDGVGVTQPHYDGRLLLATGTYANADALGFEQIAANVFDTVGGTAVSQADVTYDIFLGDRRLGSGEFLSEATRAKRDAERRDAERRKHFAILELAEQIWPSPDRVIDQSPYRDEWGVNPDGRWLRHFSTDPLVEPLLRTDWQATVLHELDARVGEVTKLSVGEVRDRLASDSRFVDLYGFYPFAGTEADADLFDHLHALFVDWREDQEPTGGTTVLGPGDARPANDTGTDPLPGFWQATDEGPLVLIPTDAGAEMGLRIEYDADTGEVRLVIGDGTVLGRIESPPTFLRAISPTTIFTTGEATALDLSSLASVVAVGGSRYYFTLAPEPGTVAWMAITLGFVGRRR